MKYTRSVGEETPHPIMDCACISCLSAEFAWPRGRNRKTIQGAAPTIFGSGRKGHMHTTVTTIGTQLYKAETRTDAFADWEHQYLDRLIHLVLELEQILERMVKTGVRLEPRIRTRLIAEFVNCAVGFSETLPKSSLNMISLAEKLEEAAGIYPPLRQISVQHNRLVVGLISETDSSCIDAEGPPLPVTMIFKGEILILDSYLCYFETYLLTFAAIERWREIREAFLYDLRKMLIPDWDLHETLAETKILVVEDNPAQMANMKRMLQRAGYGVLTASSGEDALNRARNDQPQLILLDVVLPGKSGFQICRELKDSPETDGLPVVMLINRNQFRNRSWGLDQSADGYLSKPYQKEELLDTVARHLRRRTH